MTTEPSRNSFLILPVELLYRICDFLDVETILFSFRLVCTQFYYVAKTYNQYKIYCRSITKSNIYRIISPENIVLLDLLDRNEKINWIEVFLPVFNNQQLTRLRSLSLYKIHSNQLHIILHHVANNCNLISFAIHSDISNNHWQLLSSIISQSTLRNLTLSFSLDNKDKFSWPVQCNIEKLLLGTCTVKQLCMILRNSSCLHNLILDDCHMDKIDQNVLSNVYRQLTSLTFNDFRMTMDKLEFVLKLVPSLVHLSLTSSGKPFEFVRRLSQWEEFISMNLPYLCQLEFCIFCFSSDWEIFESVIVAFRTSFWLKEKRWFVTCQFRDDWSSSFTLFTTTNLSSYEETIFDKVICSHSLR